ncbi:MarR family winged helix-turn-helix transcriptional regulator [Kineococcus sp. SYSU DK018]|uniref:MarR family winged helix-turn-helix transcriptional regulator n=1 Tax=Kineococcus sp. SYSU DK018 TaxID=3383139 RepID=UPI003D7D6F12
MHDPATDVTADPVDRARAEWAAVHPGLDTSPIAVSGRLRLVAAAVDRLAEEVVREEELTRAEFDVLCALRRSRRALTPTGVSAATLASGAATTKRLEHLTARGLLARTPDPRDGRVSRLALTPEGTALVDRVLPQVLAAEGRATAALGVDARATLADHLRTLLGVLG